MKKVILGCMILMAVLFMVRDGEAQEWAIAQEVKGASSPNPVGSGARATAWGGAFIAVADDATAASWNPAGLIQLETPETSAVLSYEFREEKIKFDDFEVKEDTIRASHADINYISMAYPFNWLERNFVVSINYQRMYEFDRLLELDLEGSRELTIGDQEYTEDVTFEQLGALTTISPALAGQIFPDFSMGLAVNFWGMDPNTDGWENKIEIEHQSYFPSSGTHLYSWSYQREEYKISGINANLGLLWTPGRFTIGAVYKFGFEGDLEYSTEFEMSQFSPDDPAMISSPVHFTEQYDEKITWPASYGIGVGYRYSDALSFALDLYMTEWSNFIVEDDEGNKYNLIAGRVDEGETDVEDTMQARAGMEYLWILEKVALALRGGAFYDGSPGDDVINEFYGLSLGTGIAYKNFVTDIAYQYRWASDIETEDILGERGESDVNEQFIIASLIYHH
jgi:long-subunit fatty acid transport protein